MRTIVAGHGYGLGLQEEALPCGATVYGHGGDIFGYSTLSLHAADGRRQLTVAITPYTGDPRQALAALTARVFC